MSGKPMMSERVQRRFQKKAESMLEPGETVNLVVFNLTIPACTSTNTGTTYNASHLNMTVDCLKVDGTTGDAELTAAVNKATGLFASSAEFPSGLKEISFKLHDSGVPGGTGDLIGWDFGTASSPCDFHAQDYATVDNGNINVHQAP